jgi:hypothetical protein
VFSVSNAITLKIYFLVYTLLLSLQVTTAYIFSVKYNRANGHRRMSLCLNTNADVISMQLVERLFLKLLPISEPIDDLVLRKPNQCRSMQIWIRNRVNNPEPVFQKELIFCKNLLNKSTVCGQNL